MIIIYINKIKNISEKELFVLYKLISEDKVSRLKKLKFKKDKIRSVVGELIIRNHIIKQYNIENDNIYFEFGSFGKPYILYYDNIHFNISHSGDYVLCAVSDKKIGIDIEKVEEIQYKHIIKKYFQRSDKEYIYRIDSKTFLEKFYEIWTVKESYIKFLGKGLNIKLDSFEILMDHCCIKTEKQFLFNSFKSIHEVKGYKIAVCSLENNLDEIKIEYIDFEQLEYIKNFMRE